MVRVAECFECGADETQVKLVFSTDGPILCEKCNQKIKG
jgi:dihydroorotate dehydrogenase